jgi:hypothetical protein
MPRSAATDRKCAIPGKGTSPREEPIVFLAAEVETLEQLGQQDDVGSPARGFVGEIGHPLDVGLHTGREGGLYDPDRGVIVSTHIGLAHLC